MEIKYQKKIKIDICNFNIMVNYIPYIPYIVTTQTVVTKMLELANITPDDIVYDLGAGDGRIIITAVKDFNAKKAVGIEINDNRVEEIIKKITNNKLENRVFIIKDNFFNVPISEATVVTMFLLTDVNDMLKPKLKKELKPGTRIISHEFEIPGWKPEKIAVVDDKEKGNRHKIYVYLI